jgi:hypothetical protein
MKKKVLLVTLFALMGGGLLFSQTSFIDTVAFGHITQVDNTWPYAFTNFSAQTGDLFPFTQQFVFAAEAGVAGSPETVDVDVTVTIDAHKFDESTGMLLDSQMIVNRFQNTRLTFAGTAIEGGEISNTDIRQINSDEVLTVIFDVVNNNPPNELYPDVQMSLTGIAGWVTNDGSVTNILLNGELAGVFKGIGNRTNFVSPVITDPVTDEPTKIVVQQGDTLQLWSTRQSSYRLNALIFVMEATVPATGLSLIAEGGTAEISELNGLLRILGDVQPANASDKRIIWSIDDKGTGATINTGGVVQAWPRQAGNGTVSVTGTLEDGTVSGSINVVISGQYDVQVDSIYLYPGGLGGRDTIDINGGVRQIWAEVYPEIAANREVDWSVEDFGTGATIDSTGILRARPPDDGNGTVIVKATAKDGSGVFDTISIVIINQQTVFVESITINYDGEFPEILENGGSLQMNATVLPEEALDRSVTWSVDDKGTGATINENGLLTASGKSDGNGLVTVTAVANDGSGVSASIDITIAGQSNVSVKESRLSDIITLYPNPIEGENTLKINISDHAVVVKSIGLYDMTGRSISQFSDRTGQSGMIEIPIKAQRGIFIVKIVTDRGTLVQRIVKGL